MVTVTESIDASSRVSVVAGLLNVIVAISRTISCVVSVPPRSAPDIVISSAMLYAVPPAVTVTDSTFPFPSVTIVNVAPVALVPAIDFCVTPVYVWLTP